jgi:hypothetical protein
MRHALHGGAAKTNRKWPERGRNQMVNIFWQLNDIFCQMAYPPWRETAK